MKSSEEKVIFSAFSHCNAFLACFTSKNENTTDSLENNDDSNMFPRNKKSQNIVTDFFKFIGFPLVRH